MIVGEKPLITRRVDGEYSTAQIGNYIETMWFPDDESEQPFMIDRTYIGLATVARRHIEQYEKEQS